ncbi:MAG: T9SS type A sorting domain-containing protein [Sporocytophaga sp.]|uniref:T9SS type A sorting domain-containing protein n=1 Tax=Sporocytophaga sp. TaxID=2231183 RepID=UPI001B01A6D5|nr:T9SS type A sorting domain-containing protein [Sporocytophaga sp.]MBO9703472.1 T9SS type A sorting domain-containing protein [Sporocytophaga sp.]
MRFFITFIILIIINWISVTPESDQYYLLQNKPVEVGTTVTFTISVPEGADPFVAWDFGDGSGLGRYKRGSSTSFKFTQPGVYQVFARIQGEDIPLYVTQTVHKVLPKNAPTHSSTICIDTMRQTVWAVNADNHSVSCIDAANYQLIREIPSGKNPRTLALDRLGNVWVANEDDATVSIISASGQKLHTIELPYASRPYGICFDPLKNYCYVTLQSTGQLMKLDAKDYHIIQITEVGRSPRGIAVTSDGLRVFVSQFISPEANGLVREIDAEAMTVKSVIDLAFDETVDFEDRGRGVPNFISSLTITPDGSEIWVPSKKDNTARGLFRDGQPLTFDNSVRTIVSKIDLVKGSENYDSRIDINDADMACAVEFSPYGNIAFIALQGNNKIAMIDASTNSRLGLLDTTGLAPQGLVFNKDGSRLFVHNFMSRSITIFNTENIILSNNFNPVKVATIPIVNKDSLNAQVLKGKQIFYNAQDERMTFAGYISCASCHLDGGSDERVWDFTDRGEGLRNTHILLGRRGIGMGNVHWTSNFDEIQDFENDIRNAFRGKGFLPDSVFNSGTIGDPLGDPKAGLSQDLDALAAYVHSLDKVNPSPYRNSDGSLTPDAIEGKLIFAELGCKLCHAGADFTDRKSGVLHDVGTINASSGQRRSEKLKGFGTPTLKGIWETAPYLHDGSAPTLRDVLITRNVDNKHGNLTALSEENIDQLLSYLLQIDEHESEPVIASLDIQKTYSNSIHVSPNPSSDFIKVCIDDKGSRNGVVSICNSVNGQTLITTKLNDVNEAIIDVSNFTPGFYMLIYTDGKQKKSTKLVIK